jgi:hypothetical protein
MAKKRAGKTVEKAKPKERDHDLQTWIRLGQGATGDESDDGLTEGERIVARGNRIVRGWLAPRQWRPDERANPFIDPFI